MSVDDLTPAARETLVFLLVDGANPPSNICDALDYSREYISVQISKLVRMGLVRDKGYQTYALTTDGVVLARAIRAEQGEP